MTKTQKIRFSHYHYAWLGNHPDRDAEWLSARLADGFDIHHIDGDHDNNSPKNLALIEHEDHMRLHGNSHKFNRNKLVLNANRKFEVTAEKYGEQCYNMKMTGMNWREIGWEFGFSESTASKYALHYATNSGEKWPLETAPYRSKRKK